MFPIKPSKQSLICLGIAVVLLLMVLGFTYYELARRLHTMDVQIAGRMDKLQSSREIAKRLADVEQEYADAQLKLSALEQGVSAPSYVPTLLRQVEDLGKSVNLRVIGVRPKAPDVAPPPPPTTDGKTTAVAVKKHDPYDKLQIDVQMTGKYSDVMRFLYGITSFPKIIAVNTLDLKPSAQPDVIASPNLTIELSTTAFILKDVAPKPVTTGTNQTAQAAVGRT